MTDWCLRCGYEVQRGNQCDCSSGEPLLDDNDPEYRVMDKLDRISRLNARIADERDADDIYDEWVDMKIEEKERGND